MQHPGAAGGLDQSAHGGEPGRRTLRNAAQRVDRNFNDVPTGHQFYSQVTKLVANGITAGVGGGNYGVGAARRLRQQMAVFLLKSKYGVCYVPPPCTGLFADVPCSSNFAPWIEALAAEGITGGCGGSNYCPANPVRRDQMAAFLLKAKHGSPTCRRPAAATSATWRARRFSPTGSSSSPPRASREAAAAATTARSNDAPRADGGVFGQYLQSSVGTHAGKLEGRGLPPCPFFLSDDESPTGGTMTFRRSTLVALCLAAASVSLEATTYTVTTTADAGAGSLRQAILDANANPGADTIAFGIVGSGVHTIAPASALPQITEPVTIDGYTQSGASPNTNPSSQGLNTVLRIEIDGTNAGATPCLFAAADDVTIRGLVVNRCADTAVATHGRAYRLRSRGLLHRHKCSGNAGARTVRRRHQSAIPDQRPNRRHDAGRPEPGVRRQSVRRSHRLRTGDHAAGLEFARRGQPGRHGHHRPSSPRSGAGLIDQHRRRHQQRRGRHRGERPQRLRRRRLRGRPRQPDPGQFRRPRRHGDDRHQYATPAASPSTPTTTRADRRLGRRGR